MIDIEKLKEQLDCRDIVEADLGRSRYRGAKSWSWRCPFHHEQKGYSLVVYADGWQCMGKCQTGGDVITWVQRHHRKSFSDACRYLRHPTHTASRELKTREVHEVTAEPPDAQWQAAARRIVNRTQETLWSPQGARALAYLEKRGLKHAAVQEAHLGYLPGHYAEGQLIEGVWVWAGITIPWFIEDALWAVNVRRPLPTHVQEDKYKLIKGSRRMGGLYWVDYVQLGTTVMFVEGEFDCLLTWQLASDLISPITLGSATNRFHSRWYPYLIGSPQILVLEDRDEAGRQMAQRLELLSQRVKRVQVSLGKDLSDYYGRMDVASSESVIRQWIKALIDTSFGRDKEFIETPEHTKQMQMQNIDPHDGNAYVQRSLFSRDDNTSNRSYYFDGY
jgi:DNA primase